MTGWPDLTLTREIRCACCVIVVWGSRWGGERGQSHTSLVIIIMCNKHTLKVNLLQTTENLKAGSQYDAGRCVASRQI